MEPNVSPAPNAPVSSPSTPTATVEYMSNPFRSTLHGLAEIFIVNPIPALLISLVGILLVIGAFILLGILLAIMASTKVGAAASIIVFLAIGILVLGFLPTLYGAYALLSTASSNKQSLGTGEFIKSALSKALTLFAVALLTLLAVVGGSILLLIPGLIFAAWFSLATYVVMNENLGAIAAMKRSHQLVKGHVLEIWGSIAASAFLGANGLLAAPVAASAFGSRYEQLKALKDSGQPKPPVHWINYLLPVALVLFIGLIILINVLAPPSTDQKSFDPSQFDQNQTVPADNSFQ